jgi:hypothetical protein
MMPHNESLFAQIARWRNNLIDFEIVVDERRRAFLHAIVDDQYDPTYYEQDGKTPRADAADAALAEAVRDRDRAAAHLARLIELAQGDAVTR